jgi:hypothetical protein
MITTLTAEAADTRQILTTISAAVAATNEIAQNTNELAHDTNAVAHDTNAKVSKQSTGTTRQHMLNALIAANDIPEEGLSGGTTGGWWGLKGPEAEAFRAEFKDCKSVPQSLSGFFTTMVHKHILVKTGTNKDALYAPRRFGAPNPPAPSPAAASAPTAPPTMPRETRGEAYTDADGEVQSIMDNRRSVICVKCKCAYTVSSYTDTCPRCSFTCMDGHPSKSRRLYGSFTETTPRPRSAPPPSFEL